MPSIPSSVEVAEIGWRSRFERAPGSGRPITQPMRSTHRRRRRRPRPPDRAPASRAPPPTNGRRSRSYAPRQRRTAPSAWRRQTSSGRPRVRRAPRTGTSGTDPATTKAMNVAQACLTGCDSSSGRLSAARALSCARIDRKFPTAIDNPSAARLAAPTINTADCDSAPPATPATTANVVMMPSLAPYTRSLM